VLAIQSDFVSKHSKINVEQSRRITDLHEQILDAIVARKKRRAVALIKEDLSNAIKLFVDGIDDQRVES
jgi:DNA-binding GntR family transcriptional regulator